MSECNAEANRGQCTCTYEPCIRKGNCCQCLSYHWRSGELPGCLFPADVERTYNRSVEEFMRTCQERGP